MPARNSNPEGSNKGSADYYDMSEDTSKRPYPNDGTQEVRHAENDDINEERTQGPVDTPAGDDWAENKVSTSLSDE